MISINKMLLNIEYFSVSDTMYAVTTNIYINRQYDTRNKISVCTLLQYNKIEHATRIIFCINIWAWGGGFDNRYMVEQNKYISHMCVTENGIR